VTACGYVQPQAAGILAAINGSECEICVCGCGGGMSDGWGKLVGDWRAVFLFA
jgi:hypothetical protein